MSYYLGRFYFEKRDFYILLLLGLLLLAYRVGYPLPYFSYKNLFFLTILFLLAKGLVLTTYDSVVFLVFLSALILTLFIPLLQVLIFLFFALVLLRLLKVI